MATVEKKPTLKNSELPGIAAPVIYFPQASEHDVYHPGVVCRRGPNGTIGVRVVEQARVLEVDSIHHRESQYFVDNPHLLKSKPCWVEYEVFKAEQDQMFDQQDKVRVEKRIIQMWEAGYDKGYIATETEQTTQVVGLTLSAANKKGLLSREWESGK